MDKSWDCLIVGAGPGGLSAALYLARFRRRVLVLHDGTSRALRIPKTHNVPGFPEGIAGPELIERMTAHATRYGAQIEHGVVVSAERAGAGFRLRLQTGDERQAPALVLATGLHMNQIPLPPAAHEAAIRAGVLRYCPICDGYEHRGQRIGVVGCDEAGAAEALFLKTYADDITLVPRSYAELGAEERASLKSAGITVEERALEYFEPGDKNMRVHLEGGGPPLEFDIVYPALGCRQRTGLANALGIPLNDEGAVDSRAPYGTVVAGLYCVGDIVDGLDQISVAMGHGAIAGTRVHNYLRMRESEP